MTTSETMGEALPLPPESIVQNTANHPVLGVAMEQGANIATGIRALGGLAMTDRIKNTPDYQTWGTFFTFVGLVATDAEGFFSRRGRKMQGKDESIRRPLNAYADHLADKTLINLTMKAIAKREKENGDAFYGSCVDVAADIIIARDALTTVDRIVADYQDIDTRAQKDGKMKAIKQYAVTGFALSPLAKNSVVKKATGLAFLFTAKESVKSGLSLHRSFKEQRAARKAAKK